MMKTPRLYDLSIRQDRDAWDALQAEAKANGEELFARVPPSHAEKKVAEFNARAADPATPGLRFDDHQGFLDNLDRIAAGRLLVKPPAE